MNRKQRRAIWGAIALLFLALLIPPWESASLIHVFRGYAFLFSTENYQSGEITFLIERRSGLRVSVSLLLVEALFISLAAAGAVAAHKKNVAEQSEAIAPQRQHEPEQSQSEHHQARPDDNASANRGPARNLPPPGWHQTAAQELVDGLNRNVLKERRSNPSVPNAKRARVLKWVLGGVLAASALAAVDPKLLMQVLGFGGLLVLSVFFLKFVMAVWQAFVKYLIER